MGRMVAKGREDPHAIMLDVVMAGSDSYHLVGGFKHQTIVIVLC